VAGGAVLYDAMRNLGHASESDFTSVPSLGRPPKKTSVVILGAGLAGLVSAYELSRAGYDVTLLEYQQRAGGRNYTLRGGDTLTEMGSSPQKIAFSKGNYLNPGPWRIPYHHGGVLHYCKTLGVALEPFIEVNHNAYLHNSTVFDGQPVRYREVAVDYAGYTSELLAKAINTKSLDAELSQAEVKDVLDCVRQYGLLNQDDKYRAGDIVSFSRGYKRDPAGGPEGAPINSSLLKRADLMRSGLSQWLGFNQTYEMQTTMFQPVGGMDMIGRAFMPHIGRYIRYGAEVRQVRQDDDRVVVSYATGKNFSDIKTLTADYCICTIPLPVLDQLDVQVSAPLKGAINSITYNSSVKIGLEFNRRFWEQDERIFGGISFTDQDILQISYPSHGYFSDGKAVLLGGYVFGEASMRLAGMSSEERVKLALEQGQKIHNQYQGEFSNGFSIAWSRIPWTLGCCSAWTDDARAAHYKNMVTLDKRVILAGEHASYVGCWQEGAVLSAHNAISQINARVHATL